MLELLQVFTPALVKNACVKGYFSALRLEFKISFSLYMQSLAEVTLHCATSFKFPLTYLLKTK